MYVLLSGRFLQWKSPLSCHGSKLQLYVQNQNRNARRNESCKLTERKGRMKLPPEVILLSKTALGLWIYLLRFTATRVNDLWAGYASNVEVSWRVSGGLAHVVGK
jgi:hypothetical protein